MNLPAEINIVPLIDRQSEKTICLEKFTFRFSTALVILYHQMKTQMIVPEVIPQKYICFLKISKQITPGL